MKDLLRAEMRRILSRPLFKALTIIVLAAFIFGGVVAYIGSDDSPERVAAARAEHREAIAGCLAAVESGVDVPPESKADPARWCREENWFVDPRFNYSEFNWMLLGLGMPFMILGWLVGASFIGAEWANRTISTTLTWESRRTRVWLAKAIVLGTGVWLWLMLLQAAFAGAMFPAAYFEGITSGLDAAWWGALGADAARVAAVGTGASLIGLAIATLGRSTAAAFGVGIAYLAVVETVIRVYRSSWTDWLLADNVGMVLVGPGDVQHLGHSQVAAALVVAAYVVVCAAIALSVFRRRDLA